MKSFRSLFLSNFFLQNSFSLGNSCSLYINRSVDLKELETHKKIHAFKLPLLGHEDEELLFTFSIKDKKNVLLYQGNIYLSFKDSFLLNGKKILTYENYQYELELLASHYIILNSPQAIFQFLKEHDKEQTFFKYLKQNMKIDNETIFCEIMLSNSCLERRKKLIEIVAYKIKEYLNNLSLYQLFLFGKKASPHELFKIDSNEDTFFRYELFNSKMEKVRKDKLFNTLEALFFFSKKELSF